MRYMIGETDEIIAYFPTGSTVTIAVWNTTTGATVSLSSSSVTEIGTTGIFKWAFSNITTAPTTKTNYAAKITCGNTILVFGFSLTTDKQDLLTIKKIVKWLRDLL